MTISLTNNLLQRAYLSTLQESPEDMAFTLNLYNNLFTGGTVSFNDRSSSTVWTIKDNLFDCDTLNNLGISALTNSNNGYRSGLTSLGGTGDKTGLVPDYQVGPLGNYYYPTNGTNCFSLVNAGSRSAGSAGLYHFTTRVDQTKEAATTVDIGFHYLALDGNGNPMDTDGDWIPDYLEDRNGNGAVDSGETDWQSPTDLGLKVWITEPKNNSNIP